jgi:hypothetical protein
LFILWIENIRIVKFFNHCRLFNKIISSSSIMYFLERAVYAVSKESGWANISIYIKIISIKLKSNNSSFSSIKWFIKYSRFSILWKLIMKKINSFIAHYSIRVIFVHRSVKVLRILISFCFNKVETSFRLINVIYALVFTIL